MSRPVLKSIAVILLALSGGLILLAQTDREYINLGPTEGIPHGIVLQSTDTYQQTFIANRQNINRLGVFLRPAVKNIPPGDVTLQLSRGEQVIAEQPVSTSFIDSEGSSQVRFDPVVPTTPGETLTLNLDIPPRLDGALRLQTRQLDESFDASNVSFSINVQTQPAPLGYQVYYQYHPTLAVQIGGLLILLALTLLTRLLNVYLLGLTVLFIAPAAMLGAFPFPVFLYAVVAMFSMSFLLTKRGLPLFPSLLGAYLFAFTSWLPLHYLAGRDYYVLAALLPLIFLPQARRTRLRLWLFALVIAISLPFFAGLADAVPTLTGVVNPRDIFLDPNQVPSSGKVPGHSWDNFGSYLGAYATALALIGIIFRFRQSQFFLTIGLAGWALSLVIPHFIILATFALAYFAALGLQALSHFIRSDSSTTNRVAQAITVIISTIILFDLWQVAARTLEFNLL